MFDDEYFDQYSTLLESKPELYASIEIRGVKDLGDLNCVTDDDNPDFFSAYARDHENLAYCIADAGMSKLDAASRYCKKSCSQVQLGISAILHSTSPIGLVLNALQKLPLCLTVLYALSVLRAKNLDF